MDHHLSPLHPHLSEHIQTLARAVEQTPACIVITDRDGNIEYVNPQFVELTGYAVGEVLGKNPSILKSGLNPQETYTRLWNAVLSGKTWRGEFCNKKKNGDLYWESASISPVRNDEGVITHIVAVKEDVTGDKRKQQQLHESEEKYRLLFEHSNDGILLSEPDGRVVEANVVACKLLGMSEEEICRRGRRDIVDPTDERVAPLLEERFRTGHASGLIRLLRGDGTFFESEISSSLFDHDGHTRATIIFRDITERKQTEEALKTSLEQLHDLDARLEHLREEERKTIAREVHDELGQVLTVLRMDLMKLKKAGSTTAPQFETGIKSMLALTDSAIKSVQDISARLRPGLLDDLGLIAAIEWQAEEFQEHSGVRCRVASAGTEITIDGQRSTALFRILQEALTNVARHAKATNVEISLTQEVNGRVTMSVRDNGVGIPVERFYHPASIGLLGMRERLRPFNGELVIRTMPRGGTEVLAGIPNPALERTGS